MNTQTTQGQRIRALRLEYRYTQEYVAAQLGTTKQAIYKYEADLIKNIPMDKLLRLSQLFACSPSWIQGLSTVRGSAPNGFDTPPLVDAPCGVPHRNKHDAEMPTEHFTFYRDLMDVMLRLTPGERRTVMQFSEFLAAQHQPAPTSEEDTE